MSGTSTPTAEMDALRTSDASPSTPADSSAPPVASSNGLQPITGNIPCFNNCGKTGQKSLTCPKCQEEHTPNAIFCSKECFAENWKTHKAKWHPSAKKAISNDTYAFPEGTSDPFKSIFVQDRRTGKREIFAYTGPLRAVYPTSTIPKRIVPSHIPRPDYADHGEALESIPERWGSTLLGRIGGKVEEVGRVIAFGLGDPEVSEQRVNKIFKKAQQGKELNPVEIEGMRKVCRMAREVLDLAAAALKPGMTTLEIDELVHRECVARDSYPSPLNYRLFPRSVCTSINEVICHGIPDARPLEDGDIINLDVTLYHGGFHGDVNATYPVGTKVSAQNLALIAATRECLDESIRACKPGALIKEFGNIITKVAHKRGFTVNTTYVGHGINQLFHPTPSIPHYANNNAAGRLKPGMTFTIEPMICTANFVDTHWPDNWTAVTLDGKPSAQFEETMLVTEDGIEVLTAAPGWTLPPMKEDLNDLIKPAVETKMEVPLKKTNKKKRY